MPDTSLLSPYVVRLGGGLVLDKDTFSIPPGSALQLQNFEPDINGGYRRLNGFDEYNASIVPQTSSSSEAVLGIHVYKDQVLVARGEKVFKGTGATTLLNGAVLVGDTTLTVDSTTGFSPTGTLLIGTEQITYTGVTATTFTGCTRGANGTTAAGYVDNTPVAQYWTEIDTGRTSAGRYDFTNFNFDNTEKVIFCDGANNASSYNNTAVTDLNAAGAPADPKFVAIFRDHVFFGGMSTNPQEIVFTAPYDETDFSTANGAGSIRFESAVRRIKSFRERLFVFCEDQIYLVTGSSIADFAVQPVTRNIGCVDGFSIQEIGGDLIYLAPDGLRTVAGTQKNDDIELGTVSKQIQPRLDNVSTDRISSLVIRKKSQYRLFFPGDTQLESSAPGVIGVIKAGVEGGIGWEYSDIKGIKPSCCATGFINGVETVLHGGYDGYVYQQEIGDTFNGTNIQAIYQGPDFTMGDAGIRKMMQRIIWNYDNEGNVDADFRVRYDFSSSAVPQPAQYPLTTGAAIAIYGNPSSLYATAVYGSSGTPLVRQSIEGSGFTVSIRLDDKDGADPISIKGYQLEFTPGGRR